MTDANTAAADQSFTDGRCVLSGAMIHAPARLSEDPDVGTVKLSVAGVVAAVDATMTPSDALRLASALVERARESLAGGLEPQDVEECEPDDGQKCMLSTSALHFGTVDDNESAYIGIGRRIDGPVTMATLEWHDCLLASQALLCCAEAVQKRHAEDSSDD